jgi:hypothetical protein
VRGMILVAKDQDSARESLAELFNVRILAAAEFGTNDNLANAVELYEKSPIERTLGKTEGDKIRAADILGLSLSTLYRKIEKLEIKDYVGRGNIAPLPDDTGLVSRFLGSLQPAVCAGSDCAKSAKIFARFDGCAHA